MATINALLGVPEEDRARLAHAADEMVGWNDDEVVGPDREPIDALTEGLVTIHAAAEELIELRRAEPADDLMTALVQAEIDGERLADEEIGAFLVLLTVAGTTPRAHDQRRDRRAARLPDQRDISWQDVDARIEPAVEECLRWTTPVMTFAARRRRTPRSGGRRSPRASAS